MRRMDTKKQEIVRVAKNKYGDDGLEITLLKLEEEAQRLAAKYPTTYENVRGYHCLIGGTGLSAGVDDFDGEDAVEEYLDRMTKEI